MFYGKRCVLPSFLLKSYCSAENKQNRKGSKVWRRELFRRGLPNPDIKHILKSSRSITLLYNIHFIRFYPLTWTDFENFAKGANLGESESISIFGISRVPLVDWVESDPLGLKVRRIVGIEKFMF